MIASCAPLNSYIARSGETRQLIAITHAGRTTVVDERIDGRDPRPIAEGLTTLEQLVAACVDHLAAHAAEPIAF